MREMAWCVDFLQNSPGEGLGEREKTGRREGVCWGLAFHQTLLGHNLKFSIIKSLQKKMKC